jgi:hypothetical protein
MALAAAETMRDMSPMASKTTDNWQGSQENVAAALMPARCRLRMARPGEAANVGAPIDAEADSLGIRRAIHIIADYH